MLKDLKILNGIMDLPFNEYIYEYTINVADDVTKLDIYYEKDDDSVVNIQNNNLVDNNIITIIVSDGIKENIYTLYINKGITSVNSIEDYTKRLDITPEGIDIYKVQFLAIIIFLIIILTFCLIFRKRN